MWKDILIQGLGFIGIALAIISLQFNSHKNIVLFKTLAEIPYLIQYVFLNAYVGMVMGVVGIIRNLVFKYRVKRNLNNKPYILLFCFITVISGGITIALSWSQTLGVMNKFTQILSMQILLGVLFSFLSIIAKLFTTVGYGIKEPRIIRALNFPASFLWLIYNLVFFSLAGVLHEIFVMMSIIIAAIRFRKVPPINELENPAEFNEKSST